MEPVDIDHIIKEWPKEWKGFAIEYSDLEEELAKHKHKGKEKAIEKEDKERVGEKCKAPQEDQLQLKKMKIKSHKPTSDFDLGLDNYEFIVNWV